MFGTDENKSKLKNNGYVILILCEKYIQSY